MRMNKKQIGLILVVGALLLSGCVRIQHQANLYSYPFFITVQRGYPPVKTVSFYNSDIDYNPIDKRIEEYLISHPETNEEMEENMRNYVISKGMNKEQVLAIAGEGPDRKDFSEQKEERWIYGSIITRGRVVIITFKDNHIVRIDDKYWDSCPNC